MPGIPPEEFLTRQERLREYLVQRSLDGAVLFDGHHILYFTGFAFIPTERPIALIMKAEGEKAMFVPRLEAERARLKTGFERVEHYAEYPSVPHPMRTFRKMLHDMGIRRRIGADNDGYPWIFGYRGPTLSELMGAKAVRRITGFVEDLMMVKSPAETAMIREAVKWSNLGHELLQRYAHIGATSHEVNFRAQYEATRILKQMLGEQYQSLSIWYDGVYASGTIGRNTSMPHALLGEGADVFREGDLFVTGAQTPMWGYHDELERTMVVGRPNDEQRRFFEHMVRVQEAAFAALKPGIRASDVDRIVRKYYEDNGLMPYWKHHVGHGLGLRYHEGPFLDIGDNTELKPGMVLSVEPGLYVHEIGGFRHSDTVLVTEDGIEILTHYPRDLESLIID